MAQPKSCRNGCKRGCNDLHTTCCGKCPAGHTPQCDTRHQLLHSQHRVPPPGQHGTAASRAASNLINPAKAYDHPGWTSLNGGAGAQIPSGCHVVVFDSGRKTAFRIGDKGMGSPGDKGIPAVAAVDSGRETSVNRKDNKKANNAEDPGSLARYNGVHQAVNLEKKRRMPGPDTGARARAEGGGQFLLPVEHVLQQKQLSDHMPQIFICGATGRKVRVLTWNIMTQCRNTRFSNNGFGKIETGEQYLQRLQAIASEVARFFKEDDTGLPMVAALQECPCSSAQRLQFQELMTGITKVIPGIAWQVMQISGSLANLTLWNGSQWRCEQSFGQRDGSRALITKLAPVCSSLPAKQCTFVNVHLEWKADSKNKEVYRQHAAHVADAVRRFMEEPGLVVVVGDFNMNVADACQTLDNYCKFGVIEASSRVWKDGRSFPNTVDGVIWRNAAK